MAPRQSPPSVDESFVLRTLTFVLSVIAGATDTIGFLGLQGLFTAHITGNVVILAARFVARDPAPVAQLISVPLFMIALILTRLLAGGLEKRRIASLLPLLMLQFLLLAGFLAIAAAAGPRIDPNALMMIVAGMLGVAAMAVQNALVRISLTGAPSTAVMTTNVTLFAIGLGDMLLARDPIGLAKGRRRVKQTGQALAGFLLGCALGAACEAAVGLRSLALPAGLALVALVLGMAASRPRAESQAAS